MVCGLPCAKKEIDNVSILGATALAISIEYHDNPFLRAQAAALHFATQSLSKAAGDLELYIDDTETEESTRKRIQAVLDESYLACDYEKELRLAADDLREHNGKNATLRTNIAHPGGTITGITPKDLAYRCQEIRVEIAGKLSKIATEALRAEGYEVPPE